MTNTLTLKETQKAILISQGIHRENKLGHGKEATYKAIEAINYIQIDSISVVERAHHHSIWNRAENYEPIHIEMLLADKQIFEYWSHAASYLPMVDYRYSLPILWGTHLSGRMDAKMDRKLGILNIINLHIETSKADEFIVELKKTLDKFLSFNNGTDINVFKITSNNQILHDSKVKKFTSILEA